MKNYRKNFIVLNMGLICFVLIVTFSFIGFETYRSEYFDLKNTMSLVIKPWNTNVVHSEKENPSKETEKHKETPSENSSVSLQKEKPPRPPKTPHETNHKYDNIATIFYDEKEEKISVLSDSFSFEYDVSDIVKEIVRQENDFGKLEQYHLIYYREKTENNNKIAVTDISYLNVRLLKIIVVLIVAFLLSAVLLFAVSFRLSKFVAEPLEKAITMERQFMTDISHDLKTPLTVIIANTSILSSNPNAVIGDYTQWLDSTNTSAKDMMNMINEMMTLSKLESVDRHFEKEKVDLSDIVRQCVLQMESVAYENGITLEWNVDENLVVTATTEYCKRICNGLLENALKYEPMGGKIIVTAITSGKQAILSVHNLNSSISQKDLPYIFDRFYRSDKTRNTIKGHGLGLSIIKRITEIIGADITVESSLEDGTQFIVSFDTSGKTLDKINDLIF